MRYTINDDDFEDWLKRLKKASMSTDSPLIIDTLDYVIEQMENELSQHIPDEKIDEFLKILMR